MKHTTSFVIPAPLETVASVLQSETYHVDEGNSRESVIETKYFVRDESESRIHFDVYFLEYKRTPLGKLDKSGQTESWSKCSWEKDKQEMHWRYDGPESKRMTMSGVYRLESIGNQTKVIHDVDLEINVPLIGKRISKIVIKELEKEMPRVQSVLERCCR